jgi:hypothetical protein
MGCLSRNGSGTAPRSDGARGATQDDARPVATVPEFTKQLDNFIIPHVGRHRGADCQAVIDGAVLPDMHLRLAHPLAPAGVVVRHQSDDFLRMKAEATHNHDGFRLDRLRRRRSRNGRSFKRFGHEKFLSWLENG